MKLYPYTYQGELTSQKALEVKESLATLVASGTTHIQIDLLGVTEADVVGVNALAITYKLVNEHDGSMTVLLKKDSQLAKMLHLTKFSQVLSLHYS
jgi:anti-anti-sigma factor